MQRLLSLLLTITALGCASATPRTAATPRHEASIAAAEELEGDGRSFALVFNGDTEPRHEQNVQAASRALSANGVQKERIFVLERRSATRAGLERALRLIEAAMRRGDRLVVYFTGHGAPNAIVTGDGSALSHDELLRAFSPFRQLSTLFVFDACYSGALPFRLVESGFRVRAMAPAADGEETECQFFAPHFWAALERHLDFDGDGKASFREAFSYAMRVYDAELVRRGRAPAHASYAESIREARVEDLRGPTLVLLTAEWCAACHAAIRELGVVQQLLGERARIVTLDVEKNPLRQSIPSMSADATRVLPTLLFVSGGRVQKEIRGARRSSEVLALLNDSLPDLDATREGIVRELRHTLKSRDSERVRFAIVALSELDAVNADLAASCTRELRRARALGFVERLESSTGYRKLFALLTPKTRDLIERERARDAYAPVGSALKKIRSRDADTRAAGWLGLFQLAKSNTSQAALLSALPLVVELGSEGDAGERRMAELAQGELLSAIEARGKPPLHFEFSGNRALDVDTLAGALREQTLAMSIAWGHALIQREYGRRGFLQALVSKPEIAYEPKSGLRLRFAVSEGAQYFFRSFRAVEGKARRPLSVAYRAPALTSGVVDTDRLAALSNDVLERYRNAGHYAADLDMDQGCDELRLCDVVLRVEPGPTYRLGAVSFSRANGGALDAAGYRKTAGLVEGSLYADTTLIAAKKRLLQLPGVEAVSVSTERSGDGKVDVSFEITSYR